MKTRHLLTGAGLLLAAVLLAGQVRQLLTDPTIWPPDDFIEYWAAARLTIDGQNPYDPELLLPLQQAAGRDTDEAVMMWNPPWSLAVVLPLGALDARLAQLLWLAVNLAAIGFCGDRLWLLLGASRQRRWIGWAVALAFLPTLFALQSGQIPPVVLLGAVLFLECRRRGWPFLAGAATLLLAIKPHLAYLVWPAILCEAIARRQFAVVAGGLSAGVVAVLVPLAFDPRLVHQYADAMANRPPSQWMTLTLGTLLRLAFGQELFRLQFVPVAFGLAWFAWHWWKHAADWDWTEQLPLLLLVSFVTTPYGAWPFDMVLLLPAVMRLVVLREHGHLAHPALILAGLVAVNLACLVMNVLQTGSFAFIWVPPAVLVLYAIGTRNPHPRTDARGSPAAVAA
ncbi:MAG TPA: glycosyltransferase family 87 protein [Gemmataceae bacterium]|nr:glycosyltransferase family 87 protein [Gemmataceae bacterium]